MKKKNRLKTILNKEKDHTMNEIQEARKGLTAIAETEARSVIFRSRAEFVEKNEKCTPYFFKRIANNRSHTNIQELNIDGNITKDSRAIEKEISGFYRDLYSKKDQMNQTIPFHLDLPKVKESDLERTERQISMNEITMALNSMPNNKAPGDDGLTVLLYKKFWKELSKPLLDCLRENITKGEMTTSQKRSVIRLIQKKGKDPTLVKNWRPISLLNIDSKIFSKCIAERIRLPMKYLIHEDQKAFVKGRLMAENIIELQTTLQKLELENTKAAVLNIDFQKAFDTIDHGALWKTMEAFGYGKNLIHLCKTLYKGATSCTINNGYTSQRFEVGRSCRQGDCVSPYLFQIGRAHV